MDEEQAKMIARAVILELGTQGMHGCEFCEAEDRRKSHRLEHEFIQGLMKIADRWENIKWDTLRDIMKWFSRAIMLATITGPIILAIK